MEESNLLYDVTALFQKGMNNDEIAEHLGIPVPMVEYYLAEPLPI